MLQQAQSGRIGCRVCCGSGEHALAVTQSNSSQASHIGSTGSSPCSRFGQFAACFAGGVITGFHCEARNEHFDFRLDSYLKRPSPPPNVETLRANSELSDRGAECRRGAAHRKRAGYQHGTLPAQVWADKPFEDYQRLYPAG